MEIKLGYSYHLKDEFFLLVIDRYLMKNKENGSYRPHYYAVKDLSNENIHWMIPISSRFEKYEKIVDRKIQKGGRCDTIVLGKFSGRKCAFLIQNAFPVHTKFISHIHTVGNSPVKVHAKLSKEIDKKMKACIVLNKKGNKVFFSDIEKILKIITSL